MSALGEGQLPVFVFPNAITFCADDQATHKQLLTLYNPYDFPLTFRVLSTCPRKYVVVDPEGTIKSRCCVDIVIRHNAVSASHCGVTDKFRIQIQEQGRRRTVLGRRDVPALLVASAAELAPSAGGQGVEGTEHFEQLPSPQPGNLPLLHAQHYALDARGSRLATSHNVTVMAAAVACFVALMLPTDGERSSSLPKYLHLTVTQKMIAAYILGLVTMVIFRA
ncbi:motile sperm domain-containing protein 1-like [Ornithodoros turicata]|uniref:motile sperm domain-containing protein 1-like n=1 Tax=Ornithodoros turicata TaxID=34597 RepID=UPI003138AC23